MEVTFKELKGTDVEEEIECDRCKRKIKGHRWKELNGTYVELEGTDVEGTKRVRHQ